MDAIGDTAHDLVDEACILLIAITASSEDGVIDADESEALEQAEMSVKRSIHNLSIEFDEARRAFGKPVCKELMNESFFVFCISAFGRMVIDYSVEVRTKPPQGQSFLGEMTSSLKELITIPLWYHYRVVSRYWMSLMGCFAFSVFMDGYSPACAITGVFLINTRVGPDVMAMIQGLLAVVVGIVMNALMYSFSCKFGNTYVLMVVSFFYWIATITVGKGSSSLAGIGLLMAALAPFAVFKLCQPDSKAAAEAQAIGLWGGIRALMIAVTITIIFEFVHIPGVFTRMARQSLNEAFVSMQDAFTHIWVESDTAAANLVCKTVVEKALADVASKLGDVETYNTACLMEPRLWLCPWKGQFVTETSGHLKKVRLDVLIIKQALCGLDGKMETIVSLMNQVVPEMAQLKQDLDVTMEDARQLTMALLDHTKGPFDGLDNLDTIEGLDTLDGYSAAIEGQNKYVDFPTDSPETMEDDIAVRISIVFVMLDYLIKHVASISKAAVKLS
jgi:hypothetical protein